MSPESHSQRINRLLANIGSKMGVAPPPFGGEPQVPPGDYSLWRNRIYVEQAVAGELTDDELSMVLAHEVGHSTRRRALFLDRISVGLPLLLGMLIYRNYLDVQSTFVAVLFLASLLWAGFCIAKGPLQEEHIADAFAVRFVGESAPYLTLLQTLLHKRGITPGPAMKKRLQQLRSL